MTYEETREAVTALLSANGITYHAAFVPQSLSRNSAEKARTLNWRCTFTRKGAPAFAIDYQQGVGHIPKMLGNPSPGELAGNEYEAAERGRYQVYAHSSWQTKALPPPHPADVISSVLLDGRAADMSFDDWAGEFGYDTDSRKAEQIYYDCVRHGRAAVALFGRPLLAQFEPLFTEY